MESVEFASYNNYHCNNYNLRTQSKNIISDLFSAFGHFGKLRPHLVQYIAVKNFCLTTVFWWCYTGGEEESRDDCLQEGMDTSQNDLLSTAEINSNSGSSASSGTQESFVHQSQGVSNHGCEGENGKTKPWCYLPGEKDLPVCDRDKDKESDQDGCSQKKIDLDISQHDLLSSPGINSNSTSIAPKDNIKEDDQEGCCQEMMDLDIPQHDLFSSVDINGNSASSAPKDNVKEDDHEGGSQKKLEVENTEQCHGPSGGVEPSNALAKVSLT